MYCNACGKPNPDDSAFCSSCGKPLTPTPAPQPAPTQPAHPSTPPTSNSTGATVLTDFRSHFRTSWREFATAPLILMLVIGCTVSVLLEIYALLTIGTLVFGAVLMTAPSLLTAMCLWFLYLDARDRSDRPIKMMGFKVLIGLYRTMLVLLCLLLLVYLFNQNGHMWNEYSYMSSSVKTVWWTETVITVGVTAFLVSWCLVIVKLLVTIRDTLTMCEPDTSYVKVTAVIEFVVSGLLIVSMFFSDAITLGTVVTSVQPFVLGVVLLKYKGFMETMYFEKVNSEIAKSEYIPAWKRVETEKATPDENMPS